MINISEKIKRYFHGPERYNCAQTVLKVFQDQYKLSDVDIERFQVFGSGRAENNLCGALYAALFLLENDIETQQKITQDFQTEVGAIKCREIRGVNKISCVNCVKIAAELLEKHSFGK